MSGVLPYAFVMLAGKYADLDFSPTTWRKKHVSDLACRCYLQFPATKSQSFTFIDEPGARLINIYNVTFLDVCTQHATKPFHIVIWNSFCFASQVKSSVCWGVKSPMSNPQHRFLLKIATVSWPGEIRLSWHIWDSTRYLGLSTVLTCTRAIKGNIWMVGRKPAMFKGVKEKSGVGPEQKYESNPFSNRIDVGFFKEPPKH